MTENTPPVIDPNTVRELEKARADIKTVRAELNAARAERDAIRTERDDAIKSRDGLKAQFDKQKADGEKALADANAAVEQAKADAEAATKGATEKANAAVIRAEAKAAAVRLGAVNPEDVVKLIDLDTVKMGEDGKIDGLDAVMEAAKENRGYLFSEPPKPGTETGTTKTTPAPKVGDPAPFDAATAKPGDVAAQARAMGLRWPAPV
ncbi:phage scaffolding protein [Komagataeibacter saccharivorans]|uniref:phage scaffolding protein n=1 Tax=Komagataeibacter saccharivorans TaxID=265959 RepID=UPI000C857AC2|nr:phage scaffolding protein [Komagataeibacter saccharivorans]